MFLDTSFLKTNEIFLKLEQTKNVDIEKGFVPFYYFKICLISDKTEVGHCDLRIGHNERLYFGGNIGYEVYELYRGNHYAAKACLLLFNLAHRHNMDYLYITCNPDNYASRKTCEYAGGILETIVDLPIDNDMYLRGERQKCIYKFLIKTEWS